MICLHQLVQHARSLSPNSIRHGHMVNLPGNVWSTKPWIRVRRKRKYKKGTYKMRLDTVNVGSSFLHETTDPQKVKYSYQLDPYSRAKAVDPIPELCKLTKTALPISLSQLYQDSAPLDTDYHSNFDRHIEECCEVFNRTYRQKKLPENHGSFTPLQDNEFALQYSNGFLHNLINYLYTDARSGEHMLNNSHTSFNLNTAAFWRVNRPLNGPDHSRFQFQNHLDILLRTTSPISYALLQTASSDSVRFEERNFEICSPKLILFKKRADVEQYPGFIKETLYPYNHTILKVVSSQLTDRQLQTAAMMTGFGQAAATTQHRLPFTAHVDVLPPVEQAEAVNVIITDGNRYCLGVYQCNTTNTCGTQFDNGLANMFALSPVASLLQEDGTINSSLTGSILQLLTSSRNETNHIPQYDGEILEY